MKHPIYVKMDIWPVAGKMSWTVLFAHGEYKLRVSGLAPTEELCRRAIRKQVDDYVASASEETPVRFHATS